jgi:hypothetical protein
MPEKPTTASGYPPGQVARVKSTCLYLAKKLGDLMDELVVVGGLVPSLLIDQEKLPENVTPHVGTLDLDLGFPPASVHQALSRQSWPLTSPRRVLDDEQGLMHKACGWVLREVGKRNQSALETFLQRHHTICPGRCCAMPLSDFLPASELRN